MSSTPPWEGARGGRPADLEATNHANQVDQLLATHNITPAYETGRFKVPFGGANLTWVAPGNTIDLDQPFVMPSSGVGTSVVRISLPLQPVGAGADLLVSLYPDNGAGLPDTTNQLASTKVPASWINALAAPDGLADGGPLATAAYNTVKATGGYQSQPWAGPVGDASGVAQDSSVAVSGNYLITAGGTTATSVVPVVNTIPYLGGTSIGRGIPQPSLPAGAAFGAFAATSTSLVMAGGATGTASSLVPTANVWVASWDPNTGSVGSWSSQAALPTACYAAGTAASIATETVYVIGGTNGSCLSSVYSANVQNGQITEWASEPNLPVALAQALCTVVNGWLIVAGGNTSPSLNTSGPIVATSYYAKINQDGSLGAWQNGPGIVAACAYAPGWNIVTTDCAAIIVAGQNGAAYVQSLTVDANGPAPKWQFFTWREGGAEMVAAFPAGTPGEWFLVNPNIPASQYFYTTLVPTPNISIPLAATLMLGATYHVVMQQVQTSSASDYLNIGLQDASPLSGPDALKSVRHSGTWTSAAGSGWNVPLSVFNNQPIAGNPIHTWEDPAATGSGYSANLAARVSTIVYNWHKLPIGLLESTLLPNDPLNSNPTFATGTSPWTAHNATLAQSSVQVHGGYSFSGLLTPAGGSATASATSELIPITAVFPLWSNAQWYRVNGWLYSPIGWSSVSLSVDWFDANNAYISTSSNTVSVGAATWTNLVNTYQPPSNAAFASINVTESGTPGATNTLYLSNVTLTLSPELTPTVPSVVEIAYSGTWPPAGVNVLA